MSDKIAESFFFFFFFYYTWASYSREPVSDMLGLCLQVKKLKSQLDQKTQRNGTENPDGEILENGTEPNAVELQSE